MGFQIQVQMGFLAFIVESFTWICQLLSILVCVKPWFGSLVLGNAPEQIIICKQIACNKEAQSEMEFKAQLLSWQKLVQKFIFLGVVSKTKKFYTGVWFALISTLNFQKFSKNVGRPHSCTFTFSTFRYIMFQDLNYVLSLRCVEIVQIYNLGSLNEYKKNIA